MKLNYKRTILVGFAFFLISAFWQAYDKTIPLIMEYRFGMDQFSSGFIMALDNILAVFMLPLFGAISDKTSTRFGRRTPFILIGTVAAVISFIFIPFIGNVWLFIALLLVTLIAMATFRSPAVALMPDVTVKPLRSKANAVINLMGTAGGILVLVLGMIITVNKDNMDNLFPYYVATCGIMLVGLIVFILTVKEPSWAREMQDEQDKLDAEAPVSDEAPATPKSKLTKSQLTSLLLILASVALWFMGYNAITSKYSLYATEVLEQSYDLTLLIAQGAAIVSYIPVGIVASKLGRRKTILAGIVMLATAFFIGNFIGAGTNNLVMYPIFALAGIGWATINVNSFPMVVELAKNGEVGKYTGYYYTASMAAQIVAPILSGFLYDAFGMRAMFFSFGTVFVLFSFATMFFVKHGDAKAEKQDALSALGGADD